MLHLGDLKKAAQLRRPRSRGRDATGAVPDWPARFAGLAARPRATRACGPSTPPARWRAIRR